MIIQEDKFYEFLNDHFSESDALLSRGIVPIQDQSGVIIAIYFNYPQCYVQKDGMHFLLQEKCIEERDSDFNLIRSFPILPVDYNFIPNDRLLANSNEVMLLRSMNSNKIHALWFSIKTGELLRETQIDGSLIGKFYVISDDLIITIKAVHRFEDFSVIVEITFPVLMINPELLTFTRRVSYQYFSYMIDNRSVRGAIRLSDGKEMDHSEFLNLAATGLLATNTYHDGSNLFSCHFLTTPEGGVEHHDLRFSDISKNQFNLTESWNFAINLPYVAYRVDNFSDDDRSEVEIFNILTGEKEYVLDTDDDSQEYQLAIIRRENREFYLCYSESLQAGPPRDDGDLRTIIYDVQKKETIFNRTHWSDDGEGDPPVFSFDKQSDLIVIRTGNDRWITFNLKDHASNLINIYQYAGSLGKMFPWYYFLIDNEVVLLDSEYFGDIDESQAKQLLSRKWNMEGRVAIRITDPTL